MFDVRDEILKIFDKACFCLRQEKKLAIQTTLLVGKLYRLNAAVNLNLAEQEYLKR